MKKLAQKRIDMYDIGDGLTLMNVINKNEDGKMHQITTYIGILGQVGTLLIHRLTHNDEIKSIQNHLDDYAVKQVKKLNQGEAVLTSVNLLHNLFVQVTKCGRKQYNETPML